MVRTSNDLAKLVPSEILAETSVQARVKVIVSFIKVVTGGEDWAGGVASGGCGGCWKWYY